MRLTALGSSSDGNCFVMTFEMGEGRKPLPLMVECGFPYQTIARKANTYNIRISELVGCLITHSHKDHSVAARDLAKRGVAMYATKGTLEAVGLEGRGYRLEYHKPTMIANGLAVMPFVVEHDAPEPAGFIIKTPFETVIFAIDSSEWVDDLSEIPADYVLIEANYDKRLMSMEQFSLQKRATLKDMQRYRLNERIKSSHMSFDDTLATLSALNKTKLKTVFLTHLSDRMSAPQIWKERVMALTGVPCRVCRKTEGIE